MIRIISGFDAAAWQQVPVTSPMQDVNWLRVMTSRLPGEVLTIEWDRRLAFIGVLISDPEAYESYNPFAILCRPEPVFELPDDRFRREWLAGTVPEPGVTLPALVLVAPGYWGDPAGPAADDAATVHDFLHSLRGWAKGRGLSSVSVLYTVRTTGVMRETFAALGGVSYPLTERWLLPVWWDDWDGYLAGLPAGRGKEIRRELRRAATAGARPVQIDPVRHLDRIVEARCLLLERYGQDADPVAERRRLTGLIDTFGDRVTGYAAVRDADPVAISVCVRHQRSVHVVFSGITGVGKQVPFAHFLATFYALAQTIGARDVDEVDYGVGHGAGKALRGCRPVTMFGHTYGVDRERSQLLRIAGAALSGIGTAKQPHEPGAAVPRGEWNVRA